MGERGLVILIIAYFLEKVNSPAMHLWIFFGK